MRGRPIGRGRHARLGTDGGVGGISGLDFDGLYSVKCICSFIGSAIFQRIRENKIFMQYDP